MEKIKNAWNSLKNHWSEHDRDKKRKIAKLIVCSMVAVSVMGVGIHMSVKKTTDHSVKVSGNTSGKKGGQDADQTDDDTDDDPPRHIPYAYDGIIDGVLSTKGLTRIYRAVGSNCELVLVGQRLITSEVVSKLDIGSTLVETFHDLDDQSWQLASATTMSDKDYENLLAIVEAEAGGEDVQGRIMVANVILNRVKAKDFPGDVTSVIWDRAGGSPQFSPTADGRIYTVTISNTTREAVNRAIDGEDLSQGALYFISPSGAETENVEWFNKNLTFLFQHGGHMFYY